MGGCGVVLVCVYQCVGIHSFIQLLVREGLCMHGNFIGIRPPPPYATDQKTKTSTKEERPTK